MNHPDKMCLSAAVKTVYEATERPGRTVSPEQKADLIFLLTALLTVIEAAGQRVELPALKLPNEC